MKEETYWKLYDFGDRAQVEDVDLEELAQEYGVDIVAVELQNAFIYDYIIVEYEGQKYKIEYNSEGYISRIEEVVEGES